MQGSYFRESYTGRRTGGVVENFRKKKRASSISDQKKNIRYINNSHNCAITGWFYSTSAKGDVDLFWHFSLDDHAINNAVFTIRWLGDQGSLVTIQ